MNYDAQSAIEIEAMIYPNETGRYPYDIKNGDIIFNHMIVDIVKDIKANAGIPVISARFHNTLVEMVMDVCQIMRRETDISSIVLSGGVWQNMTLLKNTIPALENQGFTVYSHYNVPTNDGGLALGQAAIAYHNMI